MAKKRKFTEGFLSDEHILNVLKISAGQTILDAGCGNGYMAIKFSKLVGHTGEIYAIDPDKVSISIFQKEVENSNITARVGDITKPTIFDKCSIDLVYLSTVFHIFSNEQVEGFVNEIKRILKPNGTLAIVNINKEETSFGPPIERKSSPEELKQKVTLSPLELIIVGDHFYMQTFENK